MGIFGLFKRKTKEITENKTQAELDLECELIIYNEKLEYGRVSKNTMNQLRELYGMRRADRAMWRQQKDKVQKKDSSAIDILSSLAKALIDKRSNNTNNNNN